MPLADAATQSLRFGPKQYLHIFGALDSYRSIEPLRSFSNDVNLVVECRSIFSTALPCTAQQREACLARITVVHSFWQGQILQRISMFPQMLRPVGDVWCERPASVAIAADGNNETQCGWGKPSLLFKSRGRPWCGRAFHI